MPLPLILGIGAAIAGVAGVGSGIYGAVQMKEAQDTVSLAESRHKQNIERFETQNVTTNQVMDVLGEQELNILHSFQEFSSVIEKIHNRPEFEPFEQNGVTLPKYDPESLKEVSVGAGVLLGGLGGATLGTAGGFAAAGATTGAVMALGTASTGTAISTLSGAALTKATLAALGGGALKAGGGGILLGSTILSATTLGVGLLVGGIIFGITGTALSDKADEAWAQMRKAEDKIDEICAYLQKLKDAANDYHALLKRVNSKYDAYFSRLRHTVEDLRKTDWITFTGKERLDTEISVRLVGLLYKMCQVQLVKKTENEDEVNTVNTAEIYEATRTAKEVLRDIA